MSEAERDAVKHGRKGVSHRHAKLDEDKVREIRELSKTGEYSLRALAARYSVSHVAVGDVLHGRTWRHVE